MSGSIRLIAHLSDVHMLDYRPVRSTREEVIVRLLSYARPLDPEARRQKLRRALAAAKGSGADHFVLSGDLTESGAPAEVAAFAEVLADSGIEP